MEWLEQTGFSLAGLPWWGAFTIALLTFAATKGVDGLLKWRNHDLDVRKYDDNEARLARELLVQELKDRVDKLEHVIDLQSVKLDEARKAHSKCEVEQAILQGKFDTQMERMNAMQIQIDILLLHKKNNLEHIKGLEDAVKEIDPQVAAKLP